MATPTHEVYRMLLKIDDVDSLWTFRLHDDDTLQVDIENAGDTPTAQEIATASAIRAFDQHVDFTYIATRPELQRDTPSRGVHTCQFFLSRRVDDNPDMAYTSVEKVVCVLSPTHLQCAIDFHMFTMLDAAERSILDRVDAAMRDPVAWSVAEEPVRATLLPLASGFYTFKGGLTYDHLIFQSPLILHVELLPGGHVKGTGFDSGFHPSPKYVPLTGTWTADSLEICQTSFAFFPPHDGRNNLRLRGRVSQYAFHAQWARGDWPFDEDFMLSWTDNLRVTSMRRFWSPESHALFPDAFREAVRWCLLSSLRRSKLDDLWMPSVLWPHVFRFCDSSWFV